MGDGEEGQQGIYLYRYGQLSIVANDKTETPGKTFLHRFAAPQMNEDGDIFFQANTETGSHPAIYIKKQDKLYVLFDEATPIPQGTASFKRFFNLVTFGKDIAFCGEGAHSQEGIYLYHQKHIYKVVNRKTKIPQGKGCFTHFGKITLYSDQTIVFSGQGQHSQNGIYISSLGKLNTIVDRKTFIPDTKTYFQEIYNPSFNGEAIAFIGEGENNQQGIYLYLHGKIEKIIDNQEKIMDKPIQHLSLGNHALSQKQLAFEAIFKDGESGIFVTNIPFKLDNDDKSYKKKHF